MSFMHTLAIAMLALALSTGDPALLAVAVGLLAQFLA